MEIPLGPVLGAFMNFLGLDLKAVAKNLRRVKPLLPNIGSLKTNWNRWLKGEAYPERSSVPLIFVGLGFRRIEDFKLRWEEFKETPEGQEALFNEEKELDSRLPRIPQEFSVGEARPPYDPRWQRSGRRTVKGLVEQRFAARRREISPGKAQAADSLWPQLLRNAEIVDDQIEIFEHLCEPFES